MKKKEPKWQTDFRRSWLIQCLSKATKGNLKRTGGENGFGCGGSGLNPELLQILNRFVVFDRMGFSEYEFGALSMALGRILGLKTYYRGFHFKVGEFSFYGIMHQAQLSDVKQDIRLLLKDERLKEPIHLKKNLTKEPTRRAQACGWWSYTNDYIFFKDRKMYQAFLHFLQIREDGDVGSLRKKSSSPKKRRKLEEIRKDMQRSMKRPPTTKQLQELKETFEGLVFDKNGVRKDEA